jgi:hypothetical protein
MLWIGYATFCKCCLYSCVVCVVAPCIYRMLRRFDAADANWEGAENNILTNLAVDKFKMVQNSQKDDVNLNCIICFEDFKDGDNVTTLPCNKKHSFHEKCIKNWLEQKNTCPLCNLPIT